jgi:hypothetical protein
MNVVAKVIKSIKETHDTDYMVLSEAFLREGVPMYLLVQVKHCIVKLMLGDRNIHIRLVEYEDLTVGLQEVQLLGFQLSATGEDKGALVYFDFHLLNIGRVKLPLDDGREIIQDR